MDNKYEKDFELYTKRLTAELIIAMAELNHEEVKKLCDYLRHFTEFEVDLHNPYKSVWIV